MRKILFILAALCTIHSSNAQNFQARLERVPAGLGSPNSYAVYLKLSGTSPFTSNHNRFIGTAQFPIAVTKSQATPDGISVVMDPAFLSSMTQTTGSAATYDVVVNPVVSTCHTANAGEHYFSVNLAAGSDVTRNLISTNVEFKIFTVTFTGNNIPNPDSVKLLNVTYRLAPPTWGANNANNQQCQLAIEDNMANEYTDPFSATTPLFYDKPGMSASGSAGSIASIFYGWIAGDFNSWSRSVSALPKGTTELAKATFSESRKGQFEGVANDAISLTANPINESTKLRISASADQVIDYVIVDAAGKLILSKSLNVHNGTDVYDFDNLNMLADGIYYLRAKGTTINTTVKISK